MMHGQKNIKRMSLGFLNKFRIGLFRSVLQQENARRFCSSKMILRSNNMTNISQIIGLMQSCN